MIRPGRVEDVEIESQAVGRRLGVRIITPPDYTPAAAPYPVLYFLHPWGLSPTYITDKLHIHEHLWAGISDGSLPPMVIALPVGEKSFFINAVDPPGHDWSPVLEAHEDFFRDALQQYGRFGDYLLDEVIPTVEARYHVRTDRDGRAIGGISM
ncbi:MAG: esterase family protein, partial [Chloroflexi bacterium]|nr:esterase family protein [Chloroflexota bacterium]